MAGGTSVRVTTPEEKPLRWQVVRGEVDFQEKIADGKHHYIWEVPESEQIIPEIGLIYLIVTHKEWKTQPGK